MITVNQIQSYSTCPQRVVHTRTVLAHWDEPSHVRQRRQMVGGNCRYQASQDVKTILNSARLSARTGVSKPTCKYIGEISGTIRLHYSANSNQRKGCEAAKRAEQPLVARYWFLKREKELPEVLTLTDES